MFVRDRNILRCRLFQRLHHGRGVGGIGYEEDLVVADVVGDEVVDHAAVGGAAQGVLRLARPDAAQVVGERGVDELRRARAHHQRLAEVTDVEQADRFAGGRVLAHGAGVGHRHQPSAEGREGGTQRAVLTLEGAVQQVCVGHGEQH